jgi:hypothetical protein
LVVGEIERKAAKRAAIEMMFGQPAVQTLSAAQGSRKLDETFIGEAKSFSDRLVFNGISIDEYFVAMTNFIANGLGRPDLTTRIIEMMKRRNAQNPEFLPGDIVDAILRGSDLRAALATPATSSLSAAQATVVAAANLAMPGVSGAVQAELAGTWANNNLKELARSGVAVLAMPSNYQTVLRETKGAVDNGARGMVVTVKTPDIVLGADAKIYRSGKKLITLGDRRQRYVGIKFSKVVRDGVPVIFVELAEGVNNEDGSITLEDMLVAASNIMAQETREEGTLKAGFGDEPVMGRILDGDQILQKAFERSGGQDLADYPTFKWYLGTSVLDTFVRIADSYRTVRAEMQDNLLKNKREDAEPTIMQTQLSIAVAGLPGEGVTGTLANAREFAHSMGITLFLQGVNEIAAVEMPVLIEVMRKTIGDAKAKEFLAQALSILPDSTKNSVDASKVALLRKTNAEIAQKISDIAKKSGKSIDIDGTVCADGPALLQAFSRRQLRQYSADMLRPDGSAGLGLDLGAAADALGVVAALADVRAVRFNAKADKASAEAQFKEIFDKRKAELEKQDSTISDKSDIYAVISVSDASGAANNDADAIADLAAKYGLKVQLVVKTKAEYDTHSAAIGRNNAVVVIADVVVAGESIATAVRDSAGAAGLAAEMPSTDAAGNTLRVNVTGNTMGGIEGILALAKDVFVATPEGKFNKGVKAGEDEITDMDSAEQYLATVDGPTLAKAKLKASEDMEGYGKEFGKARAALLMVLTNGQISRQQMAENTAVGNLLVAAYMKEVKIADMHKDVDKNEPRPAEGASKEVKDLWNLLKLETTTVSSVASAVLSDFSRPAMKLDQDIPADWLSLAARIGLDLLDGRIKPGMIERMRQGTDANVQMIAQLLRAA